LSSDRHSDPFEPDLVIDPDERAVAEARNGLRQFDYVIKAIDGFLAEPQRPFRLRPSLILNLHRVALEGISGYAGNYRPAGVKIKGSKHTPPGAHLVPELVEQLCDYVNDEWEKKSAIHLASYVMWLLNWIHPFADGNGRTSRALSYVVLSVRLGYRLPGKNTIPDQISADKKRYYDALEQADESFCSGSVDLVAMEELLGNLLAAQLLDIHEEAIRPPQL
jgi:Fic family protein